MNKINEFYEKYKELILYVFFGGCTTVVNYIIYLTCTRLLSVDVMIAQVYSWIGAVIFAYITNKVFVFEAKNTDTKSLIKEITSFLTARLFSLGADLAIMYVGVKLLFMNDLIVKTFAQVIVIILNYIFSKFIIFKEK